MLPGLVFPHGYQEEYSEEADLSVSVLELFDSTEAVSMSSALMKSGYSVWSRR